MQDRMNFHVNLATDNEHIWFLSQNTGCLIEIDVKSGEKKCLFDIDNNETELLYRSVYYHNKYLFLPPYNSTKLYAHNLDTGIGEYIEICEKNERFKFSGCVARGDYLYMFGDRPYIYKFNISGNDNRIIKVKPDTIGMEHNPPHWFWTEFFEEKNKIYLVMGENGLISVDPLDGLSYIRLGPGVNTWVSRNAAIENGHVYTIFTEGSSNCYVAVFDMEGRPIKKQKINIGIEWKAELFNHAEFCSGKWFVLPDKLETILVVDASEGTIIDRIYINSDKKYSSCPYTSSVIIQNHLYTIDQISNELIICNTKNNKLEKRELVFSGAEREKIDNIFRGRVNKLKEVMTEDEYCDLNTFIKGICLTDY